MQTVILNLQDEHYKGFKTAAEEKSLSVDQFIIVCADRELERIRTNRRKRSPGRPLGEGKIREISGKISAIYKRLREGQWAENSAGFEEIFGAQLAEFGILMETKNLEGLKEFYNRRPWVTLVT